MSWRLWWWSNPGSNHLQYWWLSLHEECPDPSSCSFRGKLWLSVCPAGWHCWSASALVLSRQRPLHPLPKLVQVINCTPFSEMQEAGAVKEKPMGKSKWFSKAYIKGIYCLLIWWVLSISLCMVAWISQLKRIDGVAVRRRMEIIAGIIAKWLMSVI